MITAKCCSELKMFWFNMRSYNNTSNRKSISHSFCHCINICIHPGKIMTKEFASSSITALNAVSDINRTVFITERTDLFQEAYFSNINSANSLYAFNDHRRDLLSVLLETFFQSGFIIQWKKDHIIRFIYWGDIIFIICSSNSQRSSSMKGSTECYY